MLMGFPCGSVVKNLPTMREVWVQSLDWADPLEKEMATLSSISLKNPMDRVAAWATVLGVARIQHGLVTKQTNKEVWYTANKTDNVLTLMEFYSVVMESVNKHVN